MPRHSSTLVSRLAVCFLGVLAPSYAMGSEPGENLTFEKHVWPYNGQEQTLTAGRECRVIREILKGPPAIRAPNETSASPEKLRAVGTERAASPEYGGKHLDGVRRAACDCRVPIAPVRCEVSVLPSMDQGRHRVQEDLGRVRERLAYDVSLPGMHTGPWNGSCETGPRPDAISISSQRFKIPLTFEFRGVIWAVQVHV